MFRLLSAYSYFHNNEHGRQKFEVIKPETLKLLQEDIGKTLEDIGISIGKNFSIPIAQQIGLTNGIASN
jgi:ribulose kinase